MTPKQLFVLEFLLLVRLFFRLFSSYIPKMDPYSNFPQIDMANDCNDSGCLQITYLHLYLQTAMKPASLE